MIEIKLNEIQYEEIIKALEFYLRFHTGQFSMVLEWDYKTTHEVENFVNEKLWIEQKDYRAKWLTYEISRKMMFERNKIEGIKNAYSFSPLPCSWEPFIQIKYN